MARYPLSQPVRLSTTTKQLNLDGTYTLANATALTLTILKPDGTQKSYSSPTNDGTGLYHQDVPVADLGVTGTYLYEWISTGTAAGETSGDFDVYDPFAPAPGNDYCTTEELKARLNIASSADDLQIEAAVGAASRAIDGHCERFFYQVTTTRTYVPDGLYRCKVDDLVSVSALATDPGGTTAQGGTFPVAWAASDYQLLPYNPGRLGEQWPYTSIRAVGHFTFPWVIPLLLMRMDRVQVTGVFGWPAVPEAVHMAALIAAGELYRMKDMPIGGQVPGEFAIADLGPSAASQIGRLLFPYARNPVLAA